LDIARERLRNQRIEGTPLRGAVEVVRWLVASQAQDFSGAKWALGLRARGADDAAVEAEFDHGAILRTHLMRPTWHFVTQEDLRWMLALTAPRVHAANGPRYRALGLDAATVSKATGVLARALEGGRQLTRDELRAVLARARIDTGGQRMAYILMHAELDAVICSGPRRGKQFTYALLEERAPRARRLSRADALAELARRYFHSRGPATVQDFAKWSGMTVADARAGAEAAAPRLRQVGAGGAACWSGPPAPRGRGARPTAHLLSIYDEYISSYRDRSAICEPAHARRLLGMGAALGYVVVVDGRIAGTWKRTLEKETVRIQLTPFRRLDRAEQAAVATAATRYTAFLGPERALELLQV